MRESRLQPMLTPLGSRYLCTFSPNPYPHEYIMPWKPLKAMEEIRQQGRRLLEEDILRQKESNAARCIQGAWKGWKLRTKLSELKVSGCTMCYLDDIWHPTYRNTDTRFPLPLSQFSTLYPGEGLSFNEVECFYVSCVSLKSNPYS